MKGITEVCGDGVNQWLVHMAPNPEAYKHTEAYIDYELYGLLAQVSL